MAKSASCSVSSFRSGHGNEHYILVQASEDRSADFQRKLASVEDAYSAAQKALGLDPQTAVTHRVFLSNVKWAPAVHDSNLGGTVNSPIALSVAEQAPLSGSEIALLAYHIGGIEIKKERPSFGSLLVAAKDGGNRHLWTTGLGNENYAQLDTIAKQTPLAFLAVNDELTRHRASLLKNCLRTWINFKDVADFPGLMAPRRELFEALGMARDTNYIVATACEGSSECEDALLSLVTYSQLDLQPGQVTYLYSDRVPSRGVVCYEHGVTVDYADRTQIYPAGTGDIDSQWKIRHPGQTVKQLEGALETIVSLLSTSGGAIKHLTHLVVYVSDPANYQQVHRYLKSDTTLDGVPTIIVRAPLCLPDWQAEAEGSALVPRNNLGMPRFLGKAPSL